MGPHLPFKAPMNQGLEVYERKVGRVRRLFDKFLCSVGIHGKWLAYRHIVVYRGKEMTQCGCSRCGAYRYPEK